jgi:hypothetical protein
MNTSLDDLANRILNEFREDVRADAKTFEPAESDAMNNSDTCARTERH